MSMGTASLLGSAPFLAGAVSGPVAVGGSINGYDQFRVEKAYTALPDNNTEGNFVVNIASGPSGADAYIFRGQLNYATVNGSTYSLAELVGGFDKIANDITNAAKSVTLLKGRLITVRSGSAGTTGTAIGVEVLPYITGAGSWTAWDGFKATSPILSSTGTLGTATGVRIPKQKVTGVTTGYGVNQEDAADINYFAGVAGIGTAPVATSRLTLAAGTTAISSLNIPHGAAPTSPVNGDIWTTTAGLYVRINGSTVGPLS